jgi:hypothetical protein
MLITRAGAARSALARNAGSSATVRWKMPLDVRAQDLLPAGRRELLERRAPDGAGVVDEDVERAAEVLVRRRCELDRALLCRDVAGDRDAVAELRELGRGSLDLGALA